MFKLRKIEHSKHEFVSRLILTAQVAILKPSNPMMPFVFCRQDLKMAVRQHFRKEIVLRTLELQAFSSCFKANSFEVVCCFKQ